MELRSENKEGLRVKNMNLGDEEETERGEAKSLALEERSRSLLLVQEEQT